METNNTTTSNGVQNSHTKDNAAKIVFGDPVPVSYTHLYIEIKTQGCQEHK